MNDNLNLSADLIRIGEYLYRGNDRLADKFIGVCERKYQIPRKWVKTFAEIKTRQGGTDRAADAALTLGRLLLLRPQEK